MSRLAHPWSCLLAVLAASLPAAASSAPAFSPSRISVTVQGTGPDVVLIPGLASSPKVWSGTVAALPGYRYHLVQVAGFAGTPARGNAKGAVAGGAAAEIARYIEAKGLRRPAVIGHSMGGSIALMLAARHPGAAGRVMVVDMLPAPARIAGLPSSAARPMARLLGGELAGADRLRRDLKSMVGRFGNSDWLATKSDGAVVGRSLDELLGTDLTPELDRIRIPLTVVYACPDPFKLTCRRFDRIYAEAYGRRPGTRLTPIARSGHMIMHDQPLAFRAEMARFLR